MAIERPIERQGTTQRYSDICAYGNTIYLAETPQTLDSNVATQTREVLAGIEKLLEQAGSDKTRLLMVTIYLRDIDDSRSTRSGTAGFRAGPRRCGSASKQEWPITTSSLKSPSLPPASRVAESAGREADRRPPE
jgi:enamine deaminase RidA (YjgF/YER057c/UK114 family)